MSKQCSSSVRAVSKQCKSSVQLYLLLRDSLICFSLSLTFSFFVFDLLILTLCLYLFVYFSPIVCSLFISFFSPTPLSLSPYSSITFPGPFYLSLFPWAFYLPSILFAFLSLCNLPFIFLFLRILFSLVCLLFSSVYQIVSSLCPFFLLYPRAVIFVFLCLALCSCISEFISRC